MKNRQEHILFQLVNNNDPLTSEQLAGLIGVSARTIKSEMQELRKELEEIGASLVAERNRGYSIKVNDPQLFDPFLELLRMKLGIVNNLASSNTEKFLYIARKMVSSSKYIKVDDLADEMYTSRSSLREPLKRAVEFLNSYNIITESKPGLGTRAYGKEYEVRMVMTEVFAIHFHKAKLDDPVIEYAKWLQCDKTERQEIRHTFLRTLVKSGISILDLYTQRLSIYFIITRNRFNAGYKIKLKESFIKEIKQYDEYRVARNIYDSLAAEFPGYNLPEAEIAFLAIWLLSNRDMIHIKADQSRFPTLFQSAQGCAMRMLAQVKAVHHIDLNRFDWVAGELTSMLIPVLAKEHFGLYWPNFSSPFMVSESPLALEIARTMADVYFEWTGNSQVEFYPIHQFSVLIIKILYFVQYDIRKLKFLLVSSDGISFGELSAQRLQRYFGELIESCTCVELYEIRQMDRSMYDAVLMDNVEFGYNYELPHSTIHTIPHEFELNQIHNSILVYAYQIEHLLPDPSMIHVYDDFEFISEQHFFQMISYKHCPDDGTRDRFIGMLAHNEEISSYCYGEHSVMLFGRAGEMARQAIEIFILKKPGHWNGKEIDYIVYVCMDWQNNLQKVKAVENVLSQLSLHTELYRLFIEDKMHSFDRIIRQSLKI